MTLSELKNECEKCEKCELYKSRTNLVFGYGNEHADIMLIGEAPGKNEDLEGLPFVGRSGKLLDEFLWSVGLKREDIYIANMLKCRPPENRDPKKSEQDVCIDYLYRQFQIIKPKIVVCVGRIAAQRLIDKNIKVTKEHANFVEKDGMLFTSTYHPAAILRNINNKPLALEDWQKIKAKCDELNIK